jgi:hypothetical protein
MTWSERRGGSLLRALMTMIANSAILVRPLLVPAPLAGWTAVRRSGNADAFVLAWIAGHVRHSVSAPRTWN